MTGYVGVRRGMWIVRDHHNRLVKILVQTFQDFEDFSGRMAIEVAGRFVSQQQSWIADDGTGDGDTLLLTTRKLLGKMVHSVFETNQFQGRHHMFATLLGIELGEQQREFHVFERR